MLLLGGLKIFCFLSVMRILEGKESLTYALHFQFLHQDMEYQYSPCLLTAAKAC